MKKIFITLFLILFIIIGIILSTGILGAQQDKTKDISARLDKILANQQKIIDTLADMQGELNIIKVRATFR